MEWINNLMVKLTKYEWLNILIPGIVAVIVGRAVGCNMLTGTNWCETVAIYIFWGVIASRVGALIIEPVSKMWGLVKFAEHGDYIRYEKAEPEICGHLMANGNFFRTMCALGFVLLFLRAHLIVIAQIKGHLDVHMGWRDCMLIIWFAVFWLSYIRQIKFIVSRVNNFVKSTKA